MKLFEYLEKKINENQNLKNILIKIVNATKQINDEILKSNYSIKDFKNLLMTELLAIPNDKIEKFDEALLEIKFTKGNDSFSFHFITKKIENRDEILTELVTITKNKKDAKKEIEEWLKEKKVQSSIPIKTKTMSNAINLIYFILENYKETVEEQPNLIEKPKKTKEKVKKEKMKLKEEPKENEKTKEEIIQKEPENGESQ